MSDYISSQPKVLAENIDLETFLHAYMGQHVELVDGKVTEVYTMAISEEHDITNRFMEFLLALYLDRTKEGVVRQDPFAMRLQPTGNIRQPDLMVITTDQMSRLERNLLYGGCDLAVEIISPESEERDRGRKFLEYEAGGVREYWIIDPWRKEALFYALNEDGRYIRHDPDTQGVYTSTVLPRFRLSVPILFSDAIQDTWQAVKLVEQMLATES